MFQETDDDHDELLRYRVRISKLQFYFSKIISLQIFKNHCITVSMRSLLIMRYLLDRKQLISANIWPYNKWNDSRKNCKTIMEFYFAIREIIHNDLNITLYIEYILISILMSTVCRYIFRWSFLKLLSMLFL